MAQNRHRLIVEEQRLATCDLHVLQPERHSEVDLSIHFLGLETTPLPAIRLHPAMVTALIAARGQVQV